MKHQNVFEGKFLGSTPILREVYEEYVDPQTKTMYRFAERARATAAGLVDPCDSADLRAHADLVMYEVYKRLLS